MLECSGECVVISRVVVDDCFVSCVFGVVVEGRSQHKGSEFTFVHLYTVANGSQSHLVVFQIRD